jgi:hypothetical protein
MAKAQWGKRYAWRVPLTCGLNTLLRHIIREHPTKVRFMFNNARRSALHQEENTYGIYGIALCACIPTQKSDITSSRYEVATVSGFDGPRIYLDRYLTTAL